MESERKSVDRVSQIWIVGSHLVASASVQKRENVNFEKPYVQLYVSIRDENQEGMSSQETAKNVNSIH